MKIYAVALSALLLTGCASHQVDKSPGQITRLKDGQSVTIKGRIDTQKDIGLFATTGNRKLTVSINDDTVIDTPINARRPAGEFSGKWKDKAVSALCSSERHGDWLDVRCIILIDNERTVTLSF